MSLITKLEAKLIISVIGLVGGFILVGFDAAGMIDLGKGQYGVGAWIGLIIQSWISEVIAQRKKKELIKQ